jgi:hypothetical protein
MHMSFNLDTLNRRSWTAAPTKIDSGVANTGHRQINTKYRMMFYVESDTIKYHSRLGEILGP